VIKNSYKIWIIFFTLVNLFLLFWSLELVNYFENQYSEKENINVIKPEQEFKKSLPPKDESFPNEKSKVWNAFEDNKNIENNKNIEGNNNINEVTKEDSFLENNIKKIDNVKEAGNNLLKKEKVEINEDIANKEEEINEDIANKEEEINNNSSFKDNEQKPINNIIAKKKEKKKSNNQSLVFYVQIASLSKKDLVQTEWTRLKKKYTEDMENLIYISQEVNFKDNRTFYRLLVGKFKNKNIAKIFCEKLNIKKDCIIKSIYE